MCRTFRLIPGRRDLNGWPEGDLPPGEQLLTSFRPFLEYLAASNLSPKTIQNVDNMWALGGEFIRNLHSDSSLRKKPVPQTLLQMIEDGGPSFITAAKISRDRSIRPAKKFQRFLSEQPSLMLAVTHKFPRRGTKLNAFLSA